MRLKPAVITVYIGRWIAARRKEGQIGEITATSIDQNLSILCDTIGGCERIANTPLPFAYSVMIHRTVYVYCLLLPFGLVGSIGLMTPIFSVLLAYTFLALEALAQEIEDPFGIEDNDLALNICHARSSSLCGRCAKNQPLLLRHLYGNGFYCEQMYSYLG